MATKKAKKSAAKPKKAAKKKTTAPAVDECNLPERHQLHFHNTTTTPAYWSVSGGGSKEKGFMPPLGHSTVRVNHAKSYRVAMWTDPKSKCDCRVCPAGSVIFTGRRVVVTHPH